MGFGDTKPAYEALVGANSGETYEITIVKSNGYNNWTSAVKQDGGAHPATSGGAKPAASSYTSTPAPKSNFETPEERAKKQIYIVRQSSLSTAVELLSVGSKTRPDTKEVIEVAKQFEDYVFGNSTEETYVAPKPSDLDDDIPF